MGQTIAAARYRELGNELRKRREAAGLVIADVARYTGWSKAKVWRIETGYLEVSQVDMIHYLGACEIYRGQAMDLVAECRDAAACDHPYWLRPHGQWLEDSVCSLIYHESTADASISYEPHVLPGLLQIEGYARALIRQYGARSVEQVELGVRARLERQQVLHRSKPGQFTFFIHQHALELMAGDLAIMHEQLLSLMFIDGLPHVAIRVVPASARFGGAFRLLEFAKHRPLVYLDCHLAGLFLEDNEIVDSYRALLPVIASVALDEGQSREGAP